MLVLTVMVHMLMCAPMGDRLQANVISAHRHGLLVINEPFGRLQRNTRRVQEVFVGILVIEDLHPPGADQDHIPRLEGRTLLGQGGLEVLRRNAIGIRQDGDPFGGSDIQEHPAGHYGGYLTNVLPGAT